jgi:hypothetical protein
VFRAVARLKGYAPAGLVRDGDTLPGLPDFRIAERMAAATVPGGVIV